MLPSFRAVMRALSLMLLTLGVAVGSGATARAEAPAASDLLGMDVSGWQPTVDWPRAWADGARFVYVKATEGVTFRSSTWRSHTDGGRAAGMRVGAYHFALPDRSDPVTQADFFVDNGGSWAADGMTLPPAADLEDNPYGDQCYGMSPATLVAWIRGFVDRIYARTGRHPTVYTSTRWWRACTGDAPDFGATSPLWLARWATTIGPLPAGWTAHTIWQFDDHGVFPGDQNRLNGGEDALRELALRQDSPLLDLRLEDDASGEPLAPDDEIELRITGRNAGRSPATNVGVRVELPAGLRYVPGSLRTVAGAGAPAGTPSDRIGDDRGEYRPETREAVFRIGQAAAHDRGGRVRYDVPFELRLRARVAPNDVAAGADPSPLTVTARGVWDAPLRAEGLTIGASTTITVQPPESEPEPGGPDDPDGPGGPGAPGGPGHPGGPDDPAGPGNPNGPDDPTGPEPPSGPGPTTPPVDPEAAPRTTPPDPSPAAPVLGDRASGVAPSIRPPVATARIASTVLTLRRRAGGGAVASLRIRCAAAPCVGTATVESSRRGVGGRRRVVRTVARTSVRLRAGASGRIRVALSRSQAAALRRRGTRVRLVVRLRNGDVARRIVRVREAG